MTDVIPPNCERCGTRFGPMNPPVEHRGGFVCVDTDNCIKRAADHRIACFLQGGRFGGDRGAIVAPAPQLFYVVPCDCSLLGAEAPCGQATHWHDIDKGDELGDMPKHGAYYTRVNQRAIPSGMEAALYWHVGTDRPTEDAIKRAMNTYRRNSGITAVANGSRNGRGL